MEPIHLLGAAGSALVVIVGAIVVLLRKAYQLGEIAAEIRESADKIDAAREAIEKVGEKLDRVPVHETRLGTLENAVSRITSDIRDLVRGLARMEGREEYRSGTDWTNGEE